MVNDGKASASATGCSTKVVGVAVTSDAQLVGKPERENAGKTKSSELLLFCLFVR